MPDQLSKGQAAGAGIKRAIMSDFTPRAQEVLALALKEAKRFNHNYVGTEHLLLGLIKLGQPSSKDWLKKPRLVRCRKYGLGYLPHPIHPIDLTNYILIAVTRIANCS
jgi:hypothetical protein